MDDDAKKRLADTALAVWEIARHEPTDVTPEALDIHAATLTEIGDGLRLAARRKARAP